FVYGAVKVDYFGSTSGTSSSGHGGGAGEPTVMDTVLNVPEPAESAPFSYSKIYFDFSEPATGTADGHGGGGAVAGKRVVLDTVLVANVPEPEERVGFSYSKIYWDFSQPASGSADGHGGGGGGAGKATFSDLHVAMQDAPASLLAYDANFRGGITA